MDKQQRYFQNRIIFISLIFSVVAGFIAGGLSSDLFARIDWSKVPGLSKISRVVDRSLKQEITIVTQEEQVVRVVKEASPAVVSIIVTKDLPVIRQYWRQYNPFQGTPFEDFFGSLNVPESRQDGMEKREIGGGTGFIVDASGLILTNKHVVADEKAEYLVLLNDGRKYAAKILARDPAQDIAVVKIDEVGLPVVKLGDSDKAVIGQTVITIGNALAEFSNTVSAGVISGLKRSLTASAGLGQSAEQLENVLQTDAAINPGNSGGPLINLAGEVIGINAAMVADAQNIGFALPINSAKRDLEQVKRSGRISYPYLGVRYRLIDEDLRRKNNLAVEYGVLIIRGEAADDLAVASGSPADRAGLAEGDIILEIDGQKIDKDNSLAVAIQKRNVGDKIKLKILSKGKEKMVEIILAERQ